MMFLNGFLFMTVKHQALANQEDIFEDHPRMSVTFGIMLFISGSGLGLCAMLGMTQYYSVNDNVTRDWNTPEFITIRREYTSHLEAADALKGKFLEVVLGYFGLMAFHIQVAVAGWYVFSKHRVEKLVQLKEERTQKKNFSKDGTRSLRSQNRHFKEVMIMVGCFCITVFFGTSWIIASNEQMCSSAPVLEGFKASLIDTNTSLTIASTETTIEDKIDESEVRFIFNESFIIKVACKMEMETEELIGIEYRIFAADGGADHLLYKYDGTTDISHAESQRGADGTGGGSNHALTYSHVREINGGEITNYVGDAHLEIRVFDCRHKCAPQPPPSPGRRIDRAQLLASYLLMLPSQPPVLISSTSTNSHVCCDCPVCSPFCS